MITHNVHLSVDGHLLVGVCDCGYTTGPRLRSVALAEVEAHLAVAARRAGAR